VALADREFPWSAFRERLVAETAGDGEAERTETAYYRRWLRALESLLRSRGLLSAPALAERAAEFEAGDRTAEEFVEGTQSHDHDHDH